MVYSIHCRRIQDPAKDDDGTRILVDRVWPRGIRKADARLDHWLREVAPSTELRKWFGHDPERFEAFRRAYREELDTNQEQTASLLALARQGTVTLLYAARDTQHNNAVVLEEWLREQLAADDDANEPASGTCYGAGFPDYMGW